MVIDINNPKDGNKSDPESIHTNPMPEGQEDFRTGGPDVVETQVQSNSEPTIDPINVGVEEAE